MIIHTKGRSELKTETRMTTTSGKRSYHTRRLLVGALFISWYIGLRKFVFTENVAASVFFTSLLFNAEPSLPYHFTVERTGWLCVWIKIGTTSSNATIYTATLFAPYIDMA